MFTNQYWLWQRVSSLEFYQWTNIDPIRPLTSGAWTNGYLIGSLSEDLAMVRLNEFRGFTEISFADLELLTAKLPGEAFNELFGAHNG